MPSGQISWRARAAPLKPPLAAVDATLVALQEERWLQQWEWLLDAEDSDGSDGSSIAGSVPLAPPPVGPPGTPARLPRSGSGGEQPPASTSRAQPPRVVAVHEGSGQVAGPGFTSPEFVEGRLLVFADGSLSFVWLEGLGQVTEMRRLRLKR